ncbi:MAG: zinc ribbon domain-containing protein [Candidatus Lernaella stagnicola]|nr:zinc ribbon domain-containing protein [Candidatus Lernaella stagnicola]
MGSDFDPKDERGKPMNHAKPEEVLEQAKTDDGDVELDDDHPRIEFVLLCESQGPIATRVLKAALDDAQIPAVLAGDALDVVHIYPAHDSRILVPRIRYAEANRIMEVVLSPPDEEELAREAMVETRCESCGAPVPEDATVCPECGEKFE